LGQGAKKPSAISSQLSAKGNRKRSGTKAKKTVKKTGSNSRAQRAEGLEHGGNGKKVKQ